MIQVVVLKTRPKTKRMRQMMEQEDAIFNEFALVFDDDELVVLRDTFLGFGIPWILFTVVAMYPFLRHVSRFRMIPAWVALQQSGKLPVTLLFGLFMVAIAMSLLIAVIWYVRVLKGQNIHHCSLLTPNYFLNFGYRGITVAALLDLTIVGIYILVLVPSVMIICYAIVRHIRTGFRPSTIRDRGITDLSLGFERTLRPDAEGSSQDESASAVMAHVRNAWSSLKNIGVVELSGIVVVSALWIFQLYVVFRGNVVFDDAEDEFVFRYSYVATSWVFLGMNSYLMLFHLYLGNKHSPVLSMFDLLAEGVKLTFHDRGNTDDAKDKFIERLGISEDSKKTSGDQVPQDSFSWIHYSSPDDEGENKKSSIFGFVSPMYCLSLLVLVAYMLVNAFEAEDGGVEVAYLGFTTSAAIFLFDMVILLSRRVRIFTSLRQLVLVTLLSRFGVIAFGARFWLLGIIFVYLALGLYLAHMVSRQAFRNLHRGMHMLDSKTKSHVTFLLTTIRGRHQPSAGNETSDSKNNSDSTKNKWNCCKLNTAAEVLGVATCLFGGLITLLAFVMEGSATLPSTTVRIIDDSHAQWTFAIAAVGIVIAYIPLYMTIQSIRAQLEEGEGDGGVTGKLLKITICFTTVFILVVGILIFIPTGSLTVLGLTAFLPPSLISVGRLYLFIREQDFDLVVEGGFELAKVWQAIKEIFKCTKPTVTLHKGAKTNWLNLGLLVMFIGCLCAMSGIISIGLSPGWIGWAVGMGIAAIILTAYATLHYINTLAFHIFQVVCIGTALALHVGVHAALLSGEGDGENSIAAIALSFFGFIGVLGLVAFR